MKLLAILFCAIIFASAFALLVRDYLYACRCQRCARSYGIFTRNGMEICRRCKNVIDAQHAARVAVIKAKRLEVTG
jgi:hypothetical protein